MKIAILALALVGTVALANDKYVIQLQEADVNFIAAGNKVTIVKTDDTTEAVDAIVAKKPADVVLKVVTTDDVLVEK